MGSFIQSETISSYDPATFLKTRPMPDNHQAVSKVQSLTERLPELVSVNIVAKILRVALEKLPANHAPCEYPEIVPQKGPELGDYQCREIDFWTCGFFPGCIYSLLERAIKYPHLLGLQGHGIADGSIARALAQAGKLWSDPIFSQASRTDTHDLGFVIMPHMRPRWELYNDTKAMDAIITAARSLCSRYDPKVQAIRSWDHFDWHEGVNITCMKDNFLVIIDSLCNMELLFYAAAHSGDQELAKAAVRHSHTLLNSHLRIEKGTREGYSGYLYSTIHLVNFSPITGLITERRTAQGHHRDSTWARGQAWAILGYAQVYQWTKDPVFLKAACGLSEYFLLRLETAPSCVDILLDDKNGKTAGRYVPLWDFDAPIEDPEFPLRDASAGVIAANGMLIISQCLNSRGEHSLGARYLVAAVKIVEDTIALSYSTQTVTIHTTSDGSFEFIDDSSRSRFDSILRNSTVCNNQASFNKNSAKDHGLVYADYYLIEFGTRLLNMGMI